MDNLAQKMNSQQVELYQRIQAFSLDQPTDFLSFTKRLEKDHGWSWEYAERVIEEYKKFAFLAVAAGHPVAPSDQVDQVWHLHLTYTRSYWEDFCPNILQMPFHHEPSRGGLADQVKIDNWYNQTLESYRQIFGEIPPADIWPNSQERFGRDLHFRRINTQQNWVVPKPTLPRPKAKLNQRLIFALSLSLTLVIGGCEAIGNFPNPLNFQGPDFLNFYILLAMVVIPLAYFLRFLLRLPDGDPSREIIPLTTYETAYLAGGKQRVIDAAILRLVEQELVTIQPPESRNKARTLILKKPPNHLSDPIEQAVAHKIQGEGNINKIRQLENPLLSQIEDRLQGLKLLVTSPQSWQAQLYPALLIGALLALGVAKIVVGISRDKPVGYLFFLCLIITFIGLSLWKNPIHRSRYGDKHLKNICQGMSSTQVPQTDPQFLLSFALFGSTVLAYHQTEMLASLKDVFMPPSSGDGDGGGCGGGGCGGGCGGCGGCGG